MGQRGLLDGLHYILLAPSGTCFELQFHTPESFDLKDSGLHEL